MKHSIILILSLLSLNLSAQFKITDPTYITIGMNPLLKSPSFSFSINHDYKHLFAITSNFTYQKYLGVNTMIYQSLESDYTGITYPSDFRYAYSIMAGTKKYGNPNFRTGMVVGLMYKYTSEAIWFYNTESGAYKTADHSYNIDPKKHFLITSLVTVEFPFTKYVGISLDSQLSMMYQYFKIETVNINLMIGILRD